MQPDAWRAYGVVQLRCSALATGQIDHGASYDLWRGAAHTCLVRWRLSSSLRQIREAAGVRKHEPDVYEDLAASIAATAASADAFVVSSVMELAMCSARSGSVAASAAATAASADAFIVSLVMELAMCSASATSRAPRSRSVAATAAATAASADAFVVSSVMELAMCSARRGRWPPVSLRRRPALMPLSSRW